MDYYLDTSGLSRVWTKIKQYLSENYVKKQEIEVPEPVWEPVAYTANSDVMGAVDFIHAYSCNGLVWIDFHVKATMPATTWTTLMTITQSDRRPIVGGYAFDHDGIPGRQFEIRVNSSGNLQIYAETAFNDNHLYGSIVYPYGSVSGSRMTLYNYEEEWSDGERLDTDD